MQTSLRPHLAMALLLMYRGLSCLSRPDASHTSRGQKIPSTQWPRRPIHWRISIQGADPALLSSSVCLSANVATCRTEGEFTNGASGNL